MSIKCRVFSEEAERDAVTSIKVSYPVELGAPGSG